MTDSNSPSDDQAIRQLSRDFLAAEKAQDIPCLLALLTDDVAFLLPQFPTLRGKPAVESLYRTFFAQWESEHTANIEEIRVFGNCAYAWGEESLKLKSRSSGHVLEMRGKGLSVLERQPDGSWLFARGINNLRPVPAA